MLLFPKPYCLDNFLIFHVLSGLETPEGGGVIYDGTDITGLSDSMLTR